jgi:hypothetical protein
LRFDISNINEELDDFRKRINKAAREEDDEVFSNSGSVNWMIGKNNRSKGSVHSDFMELTAAEMATCGKIAVYPVVGWWRERKHLGKVETKTRYSLVISLETPAQEQSLYTAVKNKIEIKLKVPAR